MILKTYRVPTFSCVLSNRSKTVYVWWAFIRIVLAAVYLPLACSKIEVDTELVRIGI